MPSTLRTAVARVIGARLELRSESALLLAPGRAPQRVRGSPGKTGGGGRQPAGNLAAVKIQRFVLGKECVRGEDAVPAARSGPGGREPEPCGGQGARRDDANRPRDAVRQPQ